MIVAIDGPAGVGKSSIAQKIAKQTDFVYINSGSFYRAVTLMCIRANIGTNDPQEIIETANNCTFSFKNGRLFLNNEDVENELHTDKVDCLVAEISSIPEIRNIINKSLRKTTHKMNTIVEGRDISTVVFPDADVKIYLDASVETRAKRRWKQGLSKLSLNDLKESIKRRDTIDKNKHEGKLKIADDAIYLDTSDLTIDQVCEKVVWQIRQKENRSNQENYGCHDRER